MDPSRLLRVALLPVLLVVMGCASIVEKSKEEAHASAVELYSEALVEYHDSHYFKSEDLLKELLDLYPADPWAKEATLLLGDIFYLKEGYEEAVSYYTTFSDFYPSHPKAPYAMFQKAMSHLKEILTIDRDQATTRKALFAFNDLTVAYPDSEYTATAREMVGFLRNRLAESELYIGRFYQKNRNYKGAIKRYAGILKEYPEAPVASEVLFHIGVSYLKLGEEGLATDTFDTLVREYPESPFADEYRQGS